MLGLARARPSTAAGLSLGGARHAHPCTSARPQVLRPRLACQLQPRRQVPLGQTRRVLTLAQASPNPSVEAAAPPSTSSPSTSAPAASQNTLGSRLAAVREFLTPPADLAAGPSHPIPVTAPAPLPEKDFGTLRGGRYPFAYDGVYGLPIVREVATYGEVLEAIRAGRVEEVLWFQDSAVGGGADGRCLVRYDNGCVKQSVLLPADLRIRQAMSEHCVRGTMIPPEPRHIPALVHNAAEAAAAASQVYTSTLAPPNAAAWAETDDAALRRGPRLGPSPQEVSLAYGDAAERVEAAEFFAEAVRQGRDSLQQIPPEEWEKYEEAKHQERVRLSQGTSHELEIANQRTAQAVAPKGNSWLDRITLTSDQQRVLMQWAPVIGPIVGSGLIVGLYLLARLFKGDLTDRLKMMNSEDDKKKKTALKEARIAFLEEEVPALVAKKASDEQIRKRCESLNAKLGEKLAVSDQELQDTIAACRDLVQQGVDLSAGSTTAGTRMVAEAEAEAARVAEAEGGEGGGDAGAGGDAMADMGKLNTARIRKATDPKIMDVKKKVREARRKMKRESKVQLSDEIIFFDDVAGNEQAKTELREIVDFFRKPEKFKASGAKAPKGVLLVGSPGNGKTLMARAVAGEAGVAFISSSAAEFIEMYMGLGAARVRDLFNTARSLSPCIIFIDELDAVGRQRQGGGKGNDERDNTVNQLLTEMDGFEAESQGIVVMGATNRKDVLDAALTRPGRFDRSIEVRRPDFQGRLEAVQVHLRGKPIGKMDFKKLASLTGGMSGAQIAGVCNSACFIASRDKRMEVTEADMVAAIDQNKYGRTYDSQREVGMSRKQRFAILEAGISMTATLLPAIEPVKYVTITPSVKSPLGRTVLEVNVGRYTTGMWTRAYLEQQLLVALAGRAAEEVVLGRDELSSLSQHRLQFARQIVTKMINSGMSEHPDYVNIRGLGQNYYDPSSEPGRFQLFTTTTDYNQTRSEWVDIDMELERRLNQGYAEVKALIERNRPCLDALVDLLMTPESGLVQGAEIRAVVERAAHPDDLAKRAASRELAYQ